MRLAQLCQFSIHGCRAIGAGRVKTVRFVALAASDEMMISHDPPTTVPPVARAILAVALIYLVALSFGLPQQGTRLVVRGLAHGETHGGEEADESADAEHAADPHEDAASSPGEHDSAAVATEAHGAAPPVWTIVPFCLLLLGIAVLPVIPRTSHWWESNWNRFRLAAGLALLTLAYYGFVHAAPLEGHWPAHHVVQRGDGLFDIGFVGTILGNAVLQEFVPFIVLLFSLYTISGGIRIEGDLSARPLTNAMFLVTGGLIASFIGTTGAAMLLIRPLLDTNSERKHVRHTVVFFIFVVCNCGGLLLPIGDPPLFLGYLQGVPFFWTMSLWSPWLLVNGLLILIYCALDQLVYYPRERLADIRQDITRVRKLSFHGIKLNGALLLCVVLAVAFLDPTKPFPSTNWHAPLFFREIVQLLLVAGSIMWGAVSVRRANGFSYHAILEVAALFSGIFICMQPALQILNDVGGELGITTPRHFFWITGGLSSILDNAPTYLVFFKTAQAVGGPADTLVAGVPSMTLTAISLGAVFMGAMTYIGNGPNFMVRAIAETSGVKMPSFFGYVVYSCVFLLPVLMIVSWRYLN